MKQFATLFVCLLATIPTALLAQNAPSPASASVVSGKGTGRLSGQLVDASTQKPIEFATVTLLPALGTAAVASSSCDEQGRFELKNLPAGSFRLQLSFVGYTTLLQPVTIAGQGQDLGALKLTAAAQKLGEVTVTGQRPMIESRPDRLVYNAEQDATNAGGNASDILRKTPMVNVDADGNVQLRGTSNVRILINNKPSAMLSGNLAEALKQIPADQIKAIEVVTAPSAKYDGEGSGGVINIVLKKNSLQGTNGSVGANGGNRNQGLNGALNVKRGKLGVNTKLSLFHNLYPYRANTSRTDFAPAATQSGERTTLGQLSQTSDSRNLGDGGYGQVELTYDPSPLHSFTLSGNGNLYSSSSPQTQFTQYQSLDPRTTARDTLYTRDISQAYAGRNYDLNAGYTRTFGEAHPRREWSVLAQHTLSRGNQDYRLDQYHAAAVRTGPLEYQERSLNLSRNLETTLQTDYTHPLPDSSTVEMGVKTIRRQVLSDYTLDSRLLSRQDDFMRNPLRSNAFDYHQNVLAAYGTYNFAAGKKYSFSVGTRLERTAIEGAFSTQDTPFRNSYLNVLPNLSATRNLKKPGQTVRLSYSRRIQRPQIYYLNPYVSQITANAIRFGNPGLSPETSDALELSYGTFGEKSSLNASAFVRRTGNAIDELNRYNEALARTETTFANIATNTSYGLSLYGSLKPVPALSLSSNLEPSYTRIYSASLQRTSSLLSAYVNVNASYKFAKNYTAQVFGGLWTGDVQLQTRSSGGNYYAASLKRMLFADKADLTLGLNNFFSPGITYRNTTRTDQFSSSNSFFQSRRSVRLSFNYRFGKIDASGQRQRRTIQNDDTKQGSSKGG